MLFGSDKLTSSCIFAPCLLKYYRLQIQYFSFLNQMEDSEFFHSEIFLIGSRIPPEPLARGHKPCKVRGSFDFLSSSLIPHCPKVYDDRSVLLADDSLKNPF